MVLQLPPLLPESIHCDHPEWIDRESMRMHLQVRACVHVLEPLFLHAHTFYASPVFPLIGMAVLQMHYWFLTTQFWVRLFTASVC